MWSNKYKRDNDKSYYWLPAVKEEITKIKEREVTGSGQMTGGQRPAGEAKYAVCGVIVPAACHTNFGDDSSVILD